MKYLLSLTFILLLSLGLYSEQSNRVNLNHLSVNNPIFELFRAEVQKGDQLKVKKALALVNKIIGRAKLLFKNIKKSGKSLLLEKQIEIVFNVIDRELDIKSDAKGVDQLYKGLTSVPPVFDCDTGSLLFIIIGYEFDWNIGVMYCDSPKEKDGHAFLKFYQQNKKPFFFETTCGEIYKNYSNDKFYSVWTRIFEVKKEQLFADQYLQAAQYHYFKSKDYSKAISLFTKAMTEKACDLTMDEMLYQRASCYDLLGRRKEAIADFKKAIKINPLNEAAYNDLAVVFSNNAQYRVAIKIINALLKLKPDNKECLKFRHELYYSIALDNYNSNKYKLAMFNVKKALSFSSKNSQYLTLRNDILYNSAIDNSNQGKNSKAIKDASLLVKLNPKNVEYKKLLGLSLYNRTLANYTAKEYQKAFASIKMLTKLFPNDREYLKFYKEIKVMIR